jgi:hypothetical protein
MEKTWLKRTIIKALEEEYPLFWIRRGLYCLELRAITYTYENGKELTRRLAEYDIKNTLDLAFYVHIEICRLAPAQIHPDIVTALESAFWEGAIFPHPRAQLEKYQAALAVIEDVVK